MHTRRPRILLAAVAALALLAFACNGEAEVEVDTEGDGDGGEAAATVQVALREWAVDPDTDSAPAGTIEFEAANEGTQPHEFVVIRTDQAPDELPVDAGAVAEGELTVVGEIEQFEADTTQSGQFELESGSYVLICNIPGHYQQGMYAGFTVE